MADVLTKEQRHKCMSNIKGKDTKPEIIVRKFLFSKGLRFRIHRKDLSGNPDLVLPKYKTVIFINGCFWHGHDNCKYFRLPKSNIEFWKTKINRNKERDILNIAKLTEQGWRVLRVWECEIRNLSFRQKSLDALYDLIVKPDVPPQYSEGECPRYSMVAETETPYSSNE